MNRNWLEIMRNHTKLRVLELADEAAALIYRVTVRLTSSFSRGFPNSLTAFSLNNLLSDLDKVAAALLQEEVEERRRDAAYWKPLRLELELLRHGRGT